MQRRFFFLGASVLAAVLVTFVLVAAIQISGSTASERVTNGAKVGDRDDSSAILARRAISIPFGIDAALLSAEGDFVDIQGHGTCPQSGETFKLLVHVKQESTHARALGEIEGECSASFDWTVLAGVSGNSDFQRGDEVEICGRVVIFPHRGEAITFRWCPTRILQ